METKPHQCIVCCDGKFLQYTLIINRITLDITLTLTLTTYRALKFINRIWLQKVKYIISNLGTRCEAFRTKLSTHAYSKHTQTAVKRLQECIHGSHWAPGVSASLSGLPACLPVFLPACPSVCLSAGTGMIHRAGNRDRMQRLAMLPDETPHSPETNTAQTLYLMTSYSSSTLMVSHIALSEARSLQLFSSNTICWCRACTGAGES